jgi:alcohol dehydrogenase class IV
MSEGMRGNWNYPTSIRFGAGRIAELPVACSELGIRRPLLVTDRGLAQLPIVKNAVEVNNSAGLPTTLFSDVQGNPTGENVFAGIRALKAGKHDGVIAFGGGSALDVAKAIALAAHQTGALWDFEDVGDNWLRVDESKCLPVVAVPTTSGTGSEVGRCSVIVESKSHRKVIIFHPSVMPKKVICDPELTLGLPTALTAAVGMDALSHNLEGLCSPGYHPQAIGIAMEGIRLIHKSLELAVSDGSNIEARSDLLMASLMGATAFQNGLGAMHAMAHPIGAVLGAHHGLINAIVMPYVLRHNRSAISDKMARLGRYLNLNDPTFDGVVDWILSMRRNIGIPHTLGVIGVTEANIEMLAVEASNDASGGTNPIPLTVDSLRELLLASIEG